MIIEIQTNFKLSLKKHSIEVLPSNFECQNPLMRHLN